jgi:hypothetical protein
VVVTVLEDKLEFQLAEMEDQEEAVLLKIQLKRPEVLLPVLKVILAV